MKRRRLLFAYCAIFLWGCGFSFAFRDTIPPSVRDALTRLRANLDQKFSSSGAANGQWGIEIVSLDRDESLYQRNHTQLYIPASNQKLITAAAALVQLGPEFRFETQIEADGPIIDGVLRGNLVIRGNGDPTISARFQSGDSSRVFREWAGRLKGKGIQTIDGDLLGDMGAFEPALPGRGWEWDDLLYGYATPASALQYNENQVTLEVVPAAEVGLPVLIRSHPTEGYLNVESSAVTSPPGREPRIEFERIPAKREALIVRGFVPLRGQPVLQTIAVQLPAEYYLLALKHALQSEGIEVSRCTLRAVRDYRSDKLSLLWTHYSPPLSEILKPLLKMSQNLYAETLVPTMGWAIRKEGSFACGKEVVEDTLRGMQIASGTYSYADGSGLSRRNLLSANLLVQILAHLHRQKYFDIFFNALSVAGVDGTLANRMKGKHAEGNVRAKTGSMANVSALSGYVRTVDGEMLAFSMIANNFLMPGKSIEEIQDSVLELLAAFTRK